MREGIVHSVAHPLYGVHDRLTADHFEKLILLFHRFETLNGSVSARTNKVTNAILRNLTAETVDRLAARHGIEPAGAAPWLKAFTGGSDDHSGVYLAGACTVTPRARSVEEFLHHLRVGAHEMAGCAGNSLKFAHSLYHIAYGYYRQFFTKRSQARNPLVGAIFRKLLEERQAAPTMRSRVRDLVTRAVLSTRKRRLSEVERLLVDQLQQFFDDRGEGSGGGPGAPTAGFDQGTFRTACRLSQEFGYTFLKKCVDYARRGELTQCVQTVSALGPVALGIAPYLASFASQHKDEAVQQEAARRFGFTYLVERSRGAAWLADTLDGGPDPVGAIAAVGEELKEREPDLTLLTCAERAPAAGLAVRNFDPIGWFDVPDGGAVAFPPFLEVIAHIERHAYSHLYISSPGPLGLAGLAAARLLRLRTTGVCRGNYARLVRQMTGDDGLAQLTWRYLAWFYGQMDTVIVPDEDRRYELCENGIELDKLVVMPVMAEPALV